VRRRRQRPEYVYTFVSPFEGRVDLTLDVQAPAVTDLDLFVLEDTGGGCNVVECLAASMTRLDEELSLDATTGTTYYLVVDGFAESQGDYQLTVDCVGFALDGGGGDAGPADGPADGG
jgi:hypothetical protein